MRVSNIAQSRNMLSLSGGVSPSFNRSKEEVIIDANYGIQWPNLVRKKYDSIHLSNRLHIKQTT